MYEIDYLKEELPKEFEMKDLGLLRYLLVMEVVYWKTSIIVTQRKYALDLLKEVGMLGCKPTEVPINLNHKICLTKGGKMSIRRVTRDLWEIWFICHILDQI